MSKAARQVTAVFTKMGASNVAIAGKAITIDFNGPAAIQRAKQAGVVLRGAGVGNVNIAGQTVHAYL